MGMAPHRTVPPATPVGGLLTHGSRRFIVVTRPVQMAVVSWGLARPIGGARAVGDSPRNKRDDPVPRTGDVSPQERRRGRHARQALLLPHDHAPGRFPSVARPEAPGALALWIACRAPVGGVLEGLPRLSMSQPAINRSQKRARDHDPEDSDRALVESSVRAATRAGRCSRKSACPLVPSVFQITPSGVVRALSGTMVSCSQRYRLIGVPPPSNHIFYLSH